MSAATNTLVLLIAAASLTACGAEEAPNEPAAEDHPAWRRTRVVMAELGSPHLATYDVEFEELLPELTLPAPPSSLHATESGHFVLASSEGHASLVYAGVSIVDHAQGATDSKVPHIHIYKFPPELLTYPLAGSGSAAAMSSGTRTSVFFSGAATEEASSTTFDQSWPTDEPVQSPSTVSTGLAHAGFSFPLGKALVTSSLSQGQPTILAAAPLLGDAPEALAGCSKPEVASVIDDTALVSCEATLVLLQATPNDGMPAQTSWPKPAASLRLLAGHVDRVDWFALDADGSAYRLTETAFTALDLGAAACDLQLEPGYGAFVVALMADGTLRRLESDTGSELDRVGVVDAFDCNAPERPRLAMTPTRAYVTLPDSSELLVLDAPSLRVRERIAVPSRPSLIAIAGVDLKTRNLGDLSDL